MANTGYKQATVAYKVSQPGGEPVDVDGVLTSVSGKRQAIAVLDGTVNPDPNVYEIEFYYTPDQMINGVPSVVYDAASCPIGFITATPDNIILDEAGPNATINLSSSGPWVIDAVPPGSIVTINQNSGTAGEYVLNVTRTESIGQGYYIFRNTVNNSTASVHITNVISGRPWVLEDGTWNMLGFWFDDGIWNYS